MWKCLSCKYFLENDLYKYLELHLADKNTDNIPNLCELQSEYYCAVNDYVLFKEKING